MKAQMRHLEGSGLLESLENFDPVNPEDVDMYLVAHVGSVDTVGEDLFYIRLVTPRALTQALNRYGHMWGRELLILDKYDYQEVLRIVTGVVDSVVGDTWEEIAESLSHYMTWESDAHNLHLHET